VGAFGSVDIWVNNAGVYPATPLVEMPVEEWDLVLDINLRGTFLGCQEAARRMVPAGQGGVIVNLASVAGIGGRGPGVAHYVSSKHGVIGITRQVSVELAPAGVRVLAVAPARILTPGVEAAMGRTVDEPDREDSLRQALGRAGRPDDVARVVLFCASDLAAFMSGTTLVVDGGETAR
jgi:NAD(P)-dependent dehydrogenase (short-subunit alcohol dehydrogenase family)